MANVDAPRGCVPVKMLGNKYESAGFSTYKVASGYASNIFNGMAVQLNASGTIEKAVDAKSNSAKIVGIAAGVSYTDSTGKPVWKNFWPASTATQGAVDAEIKVYDDPDQLFIVQADGAADQTSVGANAPMVGNANGNTTNGMSTMELDFSALTASDEQLRVIGIVQDPDNTAGLTNVDLVVRINDHAYTNLAGI
tara:strand:- start:2759 stop:3343 length:585 start_codon:yes stop_codon:yes gene_type:complete